MYLVGSVTEMAETADVQETV